MNKFLLLTLLFAMLYSCKTAKKTTDSTSPQASVQKNNFLWENANFYFLLTDRFKNGDSSNDDNFGRNKSADVLRGFEGGDLRGIIQKIDDNYFTDLGIDAIWMTPIVEQIHGGTDEGSVKTYAYHGYWTKDWTALDPNFGTKEDLRELVQKAHAKGIRIVLDAVVNHTGPVTKIDPAFPSDWVRTGPACTYEDYKSTVECTLVENLPDILTENNENVKLPDRLVKKWKDEGRYREEMESLDAFFKKILGWCNS